MGYDLVVVRHDALEVGDDLDFAGPVCMHYVYSVFLMRVQWETSGIYELTYLARVQFAYHLLIDVGKYYMVSGLDLAVRTIIRAQVVDERTSASRAPMKPRPILPAPKCTATGLPS